MPSVEDVFNNTEVDETKESDRKVMDSVADGAYRAAVTDFSVFSTDTGDFFVSWWFRITEGVAEGAELQSFSGVNPSSVGFIKRSVKRVTGSLPQWGDMFDPDTGRTGAVRAQVLGCEVQITQKTKLVKGKKYVNVYVDKVINGSSLPDEPTGGGAPDPDSEVNVDDLF